METGVMTELCSTPRKMKLSRCRLLASTQAGTRPRYHRSLEQSRGSFLWRRPHLKTPISGTNTAGPTKCVSLRAEMVHCFSCIIYRPQLEVIPQGRQGQGRHPQRLTALHTSPPSPATDCISLMHPHPHTQHTPHWFTQWTSNRKGSV